jgi:TonB family protein
LKRARFLLPLLFAASAYAGDPLIDRIGDSATALKKHDYEKALKIDQRVIGDMVERLGPGDAESKWFAVAVAHKALALAGLGRDDDAVWYWHVALNIYPAIAESDMSMFGAPAEFLKQHPFAPPPSFKFTPTVPPPPLPSNIQAPKVVKRVEPRYPAGARAFHVTGIAIFACVIDKNGSVRDVEIKKALPAPTLSYMAMEALRQWKFEPGTMDGKPVEVLFNLTISYTLR